MIKSFIYWCQDQQKPYGFIIYMFVSTISVLLVITFLVYVASTLPVLFLALPVGFVIAVAFSLYKCLWSNR